MKRSNFIQLLEIETSKPKQILLTHLVERDSTSNGLNARQQVSGILVKRRVFVDDRKLYHLLFNLTELQ